VNLVIATISRQITGLLFLHRIPVTSMKSSYGPFQRIHLSRPARSISFNPTHSGYLSSQILVSEPTGACRIYDYKLMTKNAVSDESGLEVPATEEGTWLLSLHAGFQSNKDDVQSLSEICAQPGYGRKRIVDAGWCLRGKGVVVLFQDGEWGVWDIEGVGPGATQGLLGSQGIRGGGLTQLSLTGYIDGPTKSTRVVTSTQAVGSKFAPMTPGTRKSTDPFKKTETGPLSGRISVVEIPSSSPTIPSEECIAFWLGETYTIIPSLGKFWASSTRKGVGSLFGAPSPTRMLKLEGIDLQGERCSGIEQIVKVDQPSAGLPSDLIILAEHRFTILTMGQSAAQPQRSNSSQMALVEKSTGDGDLDVGGIGLALQHMENGKNGVKSKTQR